jgi:hypothetical protein
MNTSRDDGKNLQPHAGLRAFTRLVVGAVVKLLRCCYQAPYLATFDDNAQEAITVYLRATLLEAPCYLLPGHSQLKMTT